MAPHLRNDPFCFFKDFQVQAMPSAISYSIKVLLYVFIILLTVRSLEAAAFFMNCSKQKALPLMRLWYCREHLTLCCGLSACSKIHQNYTSVRIQGGTL